MHFAQKLSTHACRFIAVLAALLIVSHSASANSQSQRAVAQALKGQYRSALSTARDPLARKVVDLAMAIAAGDQRLVVALGEADSRAVLFVRPQAV